MSQYDNPAANEWPSPRDAGSYPPPQDANYRGPDNPTYGGSYSQPQQPYGTPFYGQAPYGQPPYGQAPYGVPPYYSSAYVSTDPLLQTPRGMMVLASPGQRLGAFLIDYMISSFFAGFLAVAGIFLGFMVQGPVVRNEYGRYTNRNAAEAGLIFLLFVLLAVVATYGYRVVMTAMGGQTLGKKALGIKVITAEGVTPNFGIALLREVVGFIVNGFVLYIGFASLLWDPRRQTWGDKIARTFVVKVS